MTKTTILFAILLMFSLALIRAQELQDYEVYHGQVIEAEKFIASEKYDDAFRLYEDLVKEYDFVFLREYQIAAQLACYLNHNEKATRYIKKGIASGWEIKSIKKNKCLGSLQKRHHWKAVVKEYLKLRKQYEANRNEKIRKQVKKMYSKDQWRAFKVLFRLSSKAQEKYAERRFAPHSEKQLEAFSHLLKVHGYPGEKLIGNRFWMSTILSHHNSISTAYNQKDTLYPNLRPRLINALRKGQISPYEFGDIDDWYLTVKYDREKPTYGTLDPPSSSNLPMTNTLRKAIYMRPYQLRDALITIEKKIGINLYLSDRWY